MDALKCYQEHFGMINVQEIPKYTLKLSVDYINLYYVDERNKHKDKKFV